jgi:hypothetical protein
MNCEEYKQTLLSIASIIHGMEITESDPEIQHLIEDVLDLKSENHTLKISLDLHKNSAGYSY